MIYMGSKRRIAKEILPLMLRDRAERQFWVEPFVGGGNMIQCVSGRRIGGDANPYVISALKLIRDHPELIPKNNVEFSEAEYRRLREIEHPLKGFAGFAFSYGGKWMGGWRRDRNGRDYVAQAYRSALKQHPLLQGVQLVLSDYQQLLIPERSLIYCDPPYRDTTDYNCSDFDHDLFWGWCREKARQGHTVFVSERNAPQDIDVLISLEIPCKLAKQKNRYHGTIAEKLYRVGGNNG